VRGSADYERFVRKHLNLFAPAEDGEVEAGPSHVHPELGPFGPPPVEHLRDLNRQQLERAQNRAGARERWQIGTPYRGVELPTLLVRGKRMPGAAAPPAKPAKPLHLSQRIPIATGLVGGFAFAVLGILAASPALLAGLVLAPLGLGWSAVRLRNAKRRMPLVLPLDAAARSVADAYKELGELSDAAVQSLTIEPRAAGYLRVELAKATPAEGKKFAAALDELVGVSDTPRYLVSRPLADPRRGALGLLGRVLTRRPPFEERLHPVPTDLARNKERATVFAAAFRRRVGPGRLVFTQRTEEGHAARAEAASADGGYETLVRDVWV
jgi:hypothetical protein